MINGIYALILAATILGAAILIPRAIQHDMRLRELANLDDEELAAVLEADPHYIERAKAW